MRDSTKPMRERLPDSLLEPQPLERRLSVVAPTLRAVLVRALEGRPPSVEEGASLLSLRDDDLAALVAVADEIRRSDVGDIVTYVVNRNINWTNICFVGCKFCAFAHLKGDEEAYDLPIEFVLEKVEEAIERGATEVCMQGGINPELPADGYFRILRAIRDRFPDIHIHAYSPMEIMYGARRARMNHVEFLTEHKECGLDTIPGTAAEILDDDVREILSHKKLSTATWVEIIRAAHSLGIPTTSTLMYGHIETPMHIARHLDLLRRIQRETGGFTEFVPLRFIWQNTQLYREGLVRPIAQGQLDLAVYATSRLMLRGSIDNVQTSWVKLGHQLAGMSLRAGCNDMGGTLMEESISREAGADAGEFTSAQELTRLIRGMGRIPRQRDTLYRVLDEGDDDGRQPKAASYASGGWSGSR